MRGSCWDELLVCDLIRFYSHLLSVPSKLRNSNFGCAEGLRAGVASSGSKVAESGTIQQRDEAPNEQVSAPVPQQHGSKSDADHAEAEYCRVLGAAQAPAQGGTEADRNETQPRPLVAAKARADRWARYEEPSGSSRAAAAAQPSHTKAGKFNFLQVNDGSYPCHTTYASKQHANMLSNKSSYWTRWTLATCYKAFVNVRMVLYLLSYMPMDFLCRHFAGHHKQHMCTGLRWHLHSPS